MAELHERIVEAQNALHGVHPGYRTAHARGVFCAGTFTATPEAAALSRAEHLNGKPVEVTARLSNGSGSPETRDADRREGRGLAVKFHLADGSATDIVAITIPVFFVRNGDDFLDFLAARTPDPETGEIDGERLGKFLEKHPETAAAGALILPTLVPPVSYATCAFNSLQAFVLVNAGGDRQFVRYRWVPEAGEASLTDEQIEAAPREYLVDELGERIATAPVVFELTAQLAEPGDPLEDSTVAWPAEREWVTLGRLELGRLLEDVEHDGEIVVFDPVNVTDGVECSDDPILYARSGAYSVSAARRAEASA